MLRGKVWGAAFLGLLCLSGVAWGERCPGGVLRHYGVSGANFVRDDGTGLEVALLSRFAESLGVRYELVPVSPEEARALLGKGRLPGGFGQGCVLSGGLAAGVPEGTRASIPLFPFQLWLLAPGDSPLRGETSLGRTDWDIRVAKGKMKGRRVYALRDEVSAPLVESLRREGFRVEFAGEETADLLSRLRKDPEALAVLDAPRALLALSTWRDEVKRLGVLTPETGTRVLFPAQDEGLRGAFDAFAQGLWRDWSWARMARDSFPPVFNYYTPFFRRGNPEPAPLWLRPDPAYYPKKP